MEYTLSMLCLFLYAIWIGWQQRRVDPSNGICIDTAYINNHPISSKFRVKREVKIFYDIANSTDVGSV
jgi:hypothetical protein